MSRLLSLLLIAMLATPVIAQNRNQNRNPKRPTEKMPKNGVIKQVSPRVLAIETDDGGKWLVAVNANPQDISVVGKADAAWLRPGMLIRFESRFSRKGEAVAPIGAIEVISPRESVVFGLQADLPGAGGAAGNLFLDPDEAKPKPKVPRKKPKPEDTVYKVVGKIASLKKNGKATIAAGRLLKVEIDPQATVAVDVSNMALAKPGDKVNVDAWYYPNMQGRAVATRITIALTAPLTGETKKVIPPKPVERDAQPADPAKEEDDKAGDDKKEKTNPFDDDQS
ncbi:MAG: hypothetical protein QGG36_31400 [Pirellulaceae bacterium]|jgi:hypothetical protein|nr:hypothetical protein [Pirellulaceae bacterium]MDP7020346.1 hypothetical protein [Pirellulaceae bacterium]